MTIRKANLAAMALLAGLSVVAAPSMAEETEAEDELFTDAVKDFGYAGGAAWQCSDAGARAEIEREAMKSYNGLVQLFGTDEAFFFSTAFGAGTSAPIDKANCESFAKHFKDGMKQAGGQ